jgi:hypothetical protein
MEKLIAKPSRTPHFDSGTFGFLFFEKLTDLQKKL